MIQQTTSVAPAAGSSANQDHQRKVWILTGYAASFLALCGVMAYYFSWYITQ